MTFSQCPVHAVHGRQQHSAVSSAILEGSFKIRGCLMDISAYRISQGIAFPVLMPVKVLVSFRGHIFNKFCWHGITELLSSPVSLAIALCNRIGVSLGDASSSLGSLSRVSDLCRFVKFLPEFYFTFYLLIPHLYS